MSPLLHPCQHPMPAQGAICVNRAEAPCIPGRRAWARRERLLTGRAPILTRSVRFVHDDGVEVDELEQAVLRELAAIAGVLDAAEGQTGVRHGHTVHGRVPGF